MNARVNRLRLITQLVNAQVIASQEQLTLALEQEGVKVTQATLSRDLRELRAEKKVMDDGTTKYVIPPPRAWSKKCSVSIASWRNYPSRASVLAARLP